MKPYTRHEIKTAKKLAYNFAFSMGNVLLNKSFKYDGRTRIGRLSFSIFKNITVDKRDVLILRKQRKQRKQKIETATNFLSLPITRDYLRNKSDVVKILPDRIVFQSRNHWAKTQTDQKVLLVLQRAN